VPRFDRARGRYVYLTVDGLEYRVYFEESGAGVPLLLQHTAGSDGRQWRHILEDPWIGDRFRVIAYDLPYHGKSLPPAGVRWWEQEYRLTQSFLLEFIVTLSGVLELDRPVFMGCSMGGHVAVDLALHRPEGFRAVIGLEAAMRTPGGLLDVFHHPRIGGDSKPAMMHGLMSPTSPEESKRETEWGYSCGAPATFKGDLHYYSVEHDLSVEEAALIDTSKLAVYVLTGEYDWSATPEASRQLVEAIPGARFQELRGMGHFPMSENPEAFRAVLLPLLEEILIVD
jgi:pimeloyl-ACP methyl ester carboxylesterase